MAIKFIQERQGGAERSGGRLTRFRAFLYHVTGGNNPGDILLDSNIPVDGSPHPDYAGFYCNSVSAPQRVGGNEAEGSFVVQINYSSQIADIPAPKDTTGKPPWEQKAFNVSFPGTKDIVIPQTKFYQSGDDQFYPTGVVMHPATGELLIADTVESHGLMSFSYAVKRWKYSWMKFYRGTVNKEAITVLGYTFPPATAVLSQLSATRKTYINSDSRSVDYWELSVQIEDYGRIISKEIGLQGYLCLQDGKTRNIQLKDGEYGFFDESRPDLNISTPRWVSAIGVVLPAKTPIDDSNRDSYYAEMPDLFEIDWSPLGLPEKEV